LWPANRHFWQESEFLRRCFGFKRQNRIGGFESIFRRLTVHSPGELLAEASAAVGDQLPQPVFTVISGTNRSAELEFGL
jgi:hypothetical protein